jgi:hypothetical protein
MNLVGRAIKMPATEWGAIEDGEKHLLDGGNNFTGEISHYYPRAPKDNQFGWAVVGGAMQSFYYGIEGIRSRLVLNENEARDGETAPAGFVAPSGKSGSKSQSKAVEILIDSYYASRQVNAERRRCSG